MDILISFYYFFLDLIVFWPIVEYWLGPERKMWTLIIARFLIAYRLKILLFSRCFKFKIRRSIGSRSAHGIFSSLNSSPFTLSYVVDRSERIKNDVSLQSVNYNIIFRRDRRKPLCVDNKSVLLIIARRVLLLSSAVVVVFFSSPTSWCEVRASSESFAFFESKIPFPSIIRLFENTLSSRWRRWRPCIVTSLSPIFISLFAFNFLFLLICTKHSTFVEALIIKIRHSHPDQSICLFLVRLKTLGFYFRHKVLGDAQN